MTTEATESKPKGFFTPLRAIASLVGALGGLGLSHYAGVAVWVPIAAAAVLALLFILTPIGPRYFPGAIVITLAHLIWFAAVCYINGPILGAILQIAVLAVGIVWIWRQPGFIPFLILIVYEGATFIWNLSQLGWAEIGSDYHKGLAVQCSLGVAALVFLIIGFLDWRTSPHGSSPSSPAETPPAPSA